MIAGTAGDPRRVRGDVALSKVESLLVVALGEGRRMGIPLAMVTRLEEHGLVGLAVVQEHITELLDVRQAILAADPNFYLSAAADLAEV